MFKSIMRIIATHLWGFFSCILSLNHFHFITGCNIGDCMERASKCFNSLNIHHCGGNVAPKIDIQKTFDTMR